MAPFMPPCLTRSVTARGRLDQVVFCSARCAATCNGGSGWASYWEQTATELRPGLVGSGKLADHEIDRFLARCADQEWWTQTIAFTVAQGRRPGA